MKLTAVLLLATCLQIYAKGTAQTVTLSEKNAPLKKVLKEIKRQTGYAVFYEDQLLQKSIPVDIDIRSKPLQEALNLIFQHQPLSYEIIGSRIITVKEKEQPQKKPMVEDQAMAPVTIRITGIVKNENGEVMEGASVRVKNSIDATVTRANGTFTIVVPDEKAVLVVSFVGYATREIPVNNNTNIEVVLKKAQNPLDDVVIVGYGTRKKSDVTGAVSVVNEKAIHEIPAGNVAAALQGSVPGLEIQKGGGNNHPGAIPVIRIRGERSLDPGGGLNNPLIIVDGIPFNGSLNDISQDDIVSASVLKDASAAAIYGSRGANGVIIINTRRGKTGKPTITYNGYAGFNRVMGEYDLMNAEQFALMRKWAKLNASAPGAYTGIDDPKLLKDAFTFDDEYQGYLAGNNVDWQKLMYKNGFLTNHQVGISGGNESTKYDMSLSYYNADGVSRNQGMDRYTLKMSIDQKFSKFFKAGISSLNNYTTLKGMDYNSASEALQQTPFVGPYKDDGTMRIYMPNGFINPFVDYVPGAIVDNRTRLATFTNAYAEVDFTHGFKYKFNGGIQIAPETAGKFYASQTTKQTGQKNYGYNGKTAGYNYTLENILTYDKTIAGNHSINVTGLYSIQESKTEVNNTEYRDVLADYIQYYNPQYASNVTSNGSFQKWDIISYMGRLNYGFKDKYLLTFTVRADGSSRLAQGNKWHTYPSGAIAWNIAREPFLNESKTVSALKLRASYGVVGNTAIGPYETVGGLSQVYYNYGSTNVLGAYPTSPPNVTLSWENTTSLNLGLDYGLFNNRINGSIELYKTYTNDLLLSQRLPATSGFSGIRTNVGKTENWGMEFNISSVNFNGDGKNTFSWTTDLNLFFNRNKIVQLASGATRDINNSWFVGQPSSAIFDYKRTGIWQNTPDDSALAKQFGLTVTGTSSVIGGVRVEDIDGNKKIDDNDRVIIGSRQPHFEGGITNRFAYKNFDFSFIAYFKSGGLLSSGVVGGWMNTFQAGYNNLDVNYWTPSNHENYWPKPNASLQNPNYKSTLTYMSASYLKIRSMTLGYTIDPGKLRLLGAKSARFYATASNTFVFFSEYKNKFKGLDPETYNNVDVNTPPMWQMLFGLNVSF
ncbi:TonB-dependent receptor [Niastella vici]|nr:TonB-dependent receptor [Niastella vici]